MDNSKFSKVTVLERFDLGGKTYAPGTARIPSDKIEKLVEKKLILTEESLDDGERLSGTTLEAELLNVLAPHISEHGEDEGAVECLMRVLDERDTASQSAETYLRESESKGNLLGVANNRADVAEQTNRDLQSQVEILRAQVSGDQITGESDSTSATASTENTPSTDEGESEGGGEDKAPEETPVDAKQLTPIVGSKGTLSLLKEGFNTREKIKAATDEQLNDLDGIGDKGIEKLRAEFSAPVTV